MMSKDPAVLWYTSDFLTGTLTMTDEQVGKYARLLCLQHQKGHLTEKDMLNICKTYDEDVFSKFIQDEGGLFYNERMDEEINKRRAYSESRRKNRSSKKDINNICKTYDQHMENENEDEVKSIYTTEFENFFDEFHKVTGKRKEKKFPAWKHWKKLTKAEKQKALEVIPLFAKSKEDLQYLPIARTYLADKNFNDEFQTEDKEISMINKDGIDKEYGMVL